MLARVVQRPGQVGQEGVGPRLRQLAWIAHGLLRLASASSRRPKALSLLARLFSDMARSGRKASGRACASWR